MTNHYWDLTPDGQRFLINATDPTSNAAMLTVMLNLAGAAERAALTGVKIRRSR